MPLTVPEVTEKGEHKGVLLGMQKPSEKKKKTAEEGPTVHKVRV